MRATTLRQRIVLRSRDAERDAKLQKIARLYLQFSDCRDELMEANKRAVLTGEDQKDVLLARRAATSTSTLLEERGLRRGGEGGLFEQISRSLGGGRSSRSSSAAPEIRATLIYDADADRVLLKKHAATALFASLDVLDKDTKEVLEVLSAEIYCRPPEPNMISSRSSSTRSGRRRCSASEQHPLPNTSEVVYTNPDEVFGALLRSVRCSEEEARAADMHLLIVSMRLARKKMDAFESSVERLGQMLGKIEGLASLLSKKAEELVSGAVLGQPRIPPMDGGDIGDRRRV